MAEKPTPNNISADNVLLTTTLVKDGKIATTYDHSTPALDGNSLGVPLGGRENEFSDMKIQGLAYTNIDPAQGSDSQQDLGQSLPVRARNISGDASAPVPDEIAKLANIADIIELMEDSRKDKDWLIDQIKQKHQRLKVAPGMTTVALLKMCSPAMIANILADLKSKEFDPEVTIPPITREYHWFFTDIVSASDPDRTTLDQARKIILLNKIIEMTDIFKQRDPEGTLLLPTGDGMAIGFDDSPEKPLKLAIEVHRALNRYNSSRKKKEDKLEVRIGLESGPVFIIKDLNGNENVWGPGIIMARRVMDLADKMNILSSASFANDVKMLRPEYRNLTFPAGNYKIKHHEEPILIYNIYGQDFGNKKAPALDKSDRSKAAEEVARSSSKFLFSHVEVVLDIKDAKKMATHHTLIWNVVNVMKEPIDRIFYYLDGDVPKEFPDMNVIVRDEEDRELEIMSLNVNKPMHKEFFVKAHKPLKPGEKGRVLKLEYDWEEPERMYLYRFASDCKKFNIRIILPKGIQTRQKVVKVDTETGDKVYASTAAVVKYLPDRTEITWSGTNFRAYDAYRFDW